MTDADEWREVFPGSVIVDRFQYRIARMPNMQHEVDSSRGSLLERIAFCASLLDTEDRLQDGPNIIYLVGRLEGFLRQYAEQQGVTVENCFIATQPPPVKPTIKPSLFRLWRQKIFG